MSDFHFDYKQYKKKLNKRNIYFLPICLFVIVILIVAIYFIRPKENKICYYFVELGNFTQYKQANALSTELQSKNASGYIYFNGTYHVFASVYLENDHASSVVENLKNEYPNACIFVLESTKNNCSKSKNETLYNFTKSTEKLIEDLYKNIINYETNNLFAEKLELNLKNLKLEFSSDVQDFLSDYNFNKSSITLKENVIKMKDSIPTNSNVNLKYNLTKIVISYYSFLESL